jgi:hypothetical protein
LAEAPHTATATTIARPATGRVGALAQLDAGEAAIGAGVLDAGLQYLRRAIADADATGDPVLRTRRRVGRSGCIAPAVRHLPRYASAKSKVTVIGRQSRDGRCLRFLETMPSTMQGSQRCSNGVGSRPVP